MSFQKNKKKSTTKKLEAINELILSMVALHAIISHRDLYLSKIIFNIYMITRIVQIQYDNILA